MYNK
ncbi:73ae5dba-08d1-4f8b-aac8-d6f29e266260 [Thermothielavioides terrestris]|jgi:hypothetical protein